MKTMPTISKLSPQAIAALLAPVIAFAAFWAILHGLNEPSGSPAPPASSAPPATTEARLAELQRAVAASPDDPQLLASIGNLLYQRGRETGDSAFYDQAVQSFEAALTLDPRNVAAITGKATLALNDHRFADGLALARRAHRIGPALVAPYPALVDGLIETGRYAAAGRALDRLATLRPGLVAYSRISYFRELHGDLDGAAQALRLAIAAGSGTSEGAAYVRVLLANLNAHRGRSGVAAAGYREALAIDPGIRAAEVGLAHLAARRGDLDAAIERTRAALSDPASPDALAELGELEQAAGLTRAAERHYAASDRIERQGIAGGAGVDGAVTRFFANHGDVDYAVELGRRAWRSAPSVTSADAYSWALYRAGRIEAAARFSAEAMRLGSADPLFLYHAGMISRAAGDSPRARALLGRLLRQNPSFSPLYAPRAEQALRSLR
jgi:tetratricopeptide (TPR) repeat protein